MLYKNSSSKQTQTVQSHIRKLKLVSKKKVTWTADTIDNSKMNRKKSKICCIFHKEEHDEPCDKNKFERG